MPIYEYRCAACEHEFEEWQKITDGPVKVCPKCKKKKVERLISRTSFHLKGGGWYSDLYGSSKSSKGGSAESESKSEAKTEAATTTASSDTAAKPKAEKADKPEKKKEKVSKA
jgi:putative FmdB family regulatory protein